MTQNNVVTQQIRNFVAGISQQPPALRHAEQLEEQLNGFSSEANGLMKRPPSQYMFSLEGTPIINNTKPMIHDINRDMYEKYIAVFTGGGVDVYDIATGVKKQVTYESPEDIQYIMSSEPRKTLKAVTVADHTFVLNTGVYTAMSNKLTPNVWNTQGALISVKSGQYGRTYRIVVNGVEIASYTTPDGADRADAKAIDTNAIASNLASQCTEKAYSVQQGSSWLYVEGGTGGTQTSSYTKYPSRTPSSQYDYMRTRINNIGYFVTQQDESGTNFDTFVWDTYRDNGIDEVSSTYFTISVSGDKSFYDTQDWKNLVAEMQNDCWTIENVSMGNARQQWRCTQAPKLVTTTTPISSSTINSCDVYDGFNNQAMTCTMKTTQKFTNLPATAPDGFTVQIIGEKNSNADDYYVRYDANAKLWKETACPNIKTTFDGSTMPHVLVRERTGQFVFRKVQWSERASGDDDSNPFPSFVENTINDIFFYRNRLGFVSDESVILSCTADFFNFWISSVTEIQDTDTIDLSVSSNYVATLYHAIPTSDACYLFAQDTQFALTASGSLSPQTALLDVKSNFRCSTTIRPIGAGRNIYFPVERAEYTSIDEFFTAQDNTGEKDVQDISTHVATFIKNGVYKVFGSTVEHMILVLSEGEPNTVYVYKYLFIDGQKQQAAWSKWTFGDEIVGGSFIDNYLYLVINRNNVYCVERMSFTNGTKEYDEEPYRVLLDRKVTYKIPTENFDEIQETTTINLLVPYNITALPTGKTYGVVTSNGSYFTTDTSTVTLQGNYGGQTVIIGEEYEFRMVLSQIMIKKKDTTGVTTSVTTGRLQLQRIRFSYSDSGNFTVSVCDTDKGTAYTKVNTTHIIGDRQQTLGNTVFTDGEFEVPIHMQSKHCQIKLVSSSPQPVSITGATWQGRYNTAGRSL